MHMSAQDNNDTGRRKIFLINPRFQKVFVGKMVGLALVVSAIFYASHLYFFWKANQMGLEIGLANDHVFFKFIAEQQRAMSWVFLVTSAAVSGLLVIFGMAYSHRIAGPLHHLRRYLKDRSEGRAQGPLVFRSSDYFQEVAESLNDYIHKSEKSQNTATKKAA